MEWMDLCKNIWSKSICCLDEVYKFWTQSSKKTFIKGQSTTKNTAHFLYRWMISTNAITLTTNHPYRASCWCILHPWVGVHLWDHREVEGTQIMTYWLWHTAIKNLRGKDQFDLNKLTKGKKNTGKQRDPCLQMVFKYDNIARQYQHFA